ncbi:MAG TPA: hypothetical protein VFR90_06185 [Methylibium sp.]|uniref:hypothetical protein n=1 Tax=Methylibium sp. TaxID=2067992 RepID=UPI002DBDF020|nr:hypothetical protein [Methylibium sp.]HEU4458694.1 hypothetical protein [Methylibium sp.]
MLDVEPGHLEVGLLVRCRELERPRRVAEQGPGLARSPLTRDVRQGVEFRERAARQVVRRRRRRCAALPGAQLLEGLRRVGRRGAQRRQARLVFTRLLALPVSERAVPRLADAPTHRLALQ